MMKETDEETTEEEKVEEQTFDRKYGKETYIQRINTNGQKRWDNNKKTERWSLSHS